MKSKLVLACASLSLLPATSVAVPTIYTYTGKPYTSIHDDQLPSGTYSTDMRVTGSIILHEAIGPNASVSPSIYFATFSFNDGRVTYNEGNVGAIGYGSINLETNSSGGIDAWRIELDTPLEPSPDGAFLLLKSSCVLVFESCDHASYISGPTIGVDVAESRIAGTWTVTSIPEPSTYTFFLAGIALVGLGARRRSKLPT